jgi:N-ethylmaleimide reductase
MTIHQATGHPATSGIGLTTLPHKVVHAPTTRLRADADETPSAMMADYRLG